MPRLMLTDEQWSKLRSIMREYGIYDKPNLRKTVEGIFYRMRTGRPKRVASSKPITSTAKSEKLSPIVD